MLRMKQIAAEVTNVSQDDGNQVQISDWWVVRSIVLFLSPEGENQYLVTPTTLSILIYVIVALDQL